MKAALPEMQLEKAWESLIAQAGAYQAKLGTQPPTHQDQYTIVVITLQFEKAPIDLRVVVDSNTGLISGLRFMPNQSEAAKKYQAPTYADPNAFEEREVTVGTGEWQLPGTLTLPKGQGPFPVVVLVHGSGPNDRDETVGPNKPFKDLAWGLASRGIAVLRYDKRTKVYADKLASAANLTVKEETTDDAIAAADLLRQTDSVDPTRIFVLGHSLGGMLAPRIGQAHTNNAGLIIMAGPTLPLEDLIVEQTQYILSLHGTPTPDDQKRIDALNQQVAITKALKPTDAVSSTTTILGAPAQYWLDLQAYKPADVASTLKIPMLILQGERDYQVTMQDFQNWKEALSSHSNVQIEDLL
jgi:dienelactone hydrolase